jgi:hypothetical protein
VKLSEQRFDTRRVCHTLIELERDFRRNAKSQGPAYSRPQMRSRTRQPVEGGGAFRVTAENANEHLGMSQIAGHVDSSHGHESDDAGILDPFGKECRHFFPNGFGNSVRATGVMRHMSLQSFARPEDRANGRAGRVGRSRDTERLGDRGTKKGLAGQCAPDQPE